MKVDWCTVKVSSGLVADNQKAISAFDDKAPRYERSIKIPLLRTFSKISTAS